MQTSPSPRRQSRTQTDDGSGQPHGRAVADRAAGSTAAAHGPAAAVLSSDGSRMPLRRLDVSHR
jgi:hypothetical protein